MSLKAGARLGPYELLGLLGAGGMGEVYRARDPRLSREVAIKVLPAEVAGDPDRLRRFEQEARAAGALDHPNVLAVHDVGTHDGQPYLVFELLEGETLRSALRGHRLAVSRAGDYAIQIARGLAAAHAKGIVHRDLKPENLFLTRDGRVKILDFGLAKLFEPQGGPVAEDETRSALTSEGVVLGTAGYMSPEQVRGEPADQRSDIFALGAVLHEMLCGRRPFGGETRPERAAILREDPRRWWTCRRCWTGSSGVAWRSVLTTASIPPTISPWRSKPQATPLPRSRCQSGPGQSDARRSLSGSPVWWRPRESLLGAARPRRRSRRSGSSPSAGAMCRPPSSCRTAAPSSIRRSGTGNGPRRSNLAWIPQSRVRSAFRGPSWSGLHRARYS